MKKLDLIVILFMVLSIVVGGVVLAVSPWAAKMEGNGILSGGHLPKYDVVETDIGWNFKVKAADNTVVGNLNIVEKLVEEGPPRHFQLTGAEVDMLSYNCTTDELRVEGTNGAGQRVAAHFRGYNNISFPNTVWYWVKIEGSFITNCGTRLTLDGDDFTIDCNP
jgi:hypothetical protein